MSNHGNNNNNGQAPRIQLMGFYEKKTGAGKTYLAGNLGGVRVSIFRNGYKTKDNQPDWIAYVSPNDRRNNGGGNSQGGGAPGEGEGFGDFGGFQGDDGSDTIPF